MDWRPAGPLVWPARRCSWGSPSPRRSPSSASSCSSSPEEAASVYQLFAPLVLLAQVEETTPVDEPSGIDLLLPPTSELIAGLIAFVIIFAFVWRWVLPAGNRTLEARQQAITGQLTAAEEAKREAESLLADYKAQLAKARDEANRIVEEARSTGETLRRRTCGRGP